MHALLAYACATAGNSCPEVLEAFFTKTVWGDDPELRNLISQILMEPPVSLFCIQPSSIPALEKSDSPGSGTHSLSMANASTATGGW